MNAVIYSRVSSQYQENERQIVELRQIASEKGWTVKRVFKEKISGTIDSSQRPEFNNMLKYLDQHRDINIVMASEVSRLGRRVVDVLNTVDILHKKEIGIFLPRFRELTYENGKENPTTKLLLQMFSIGAEMENDLRRQRQLEGIQLAKMKNRYQGRKKGAKADPKDLLDKYKDVVDLVVKSDLSLRRVAQITNHSINTIRKINALTGI
jgi:DNA invertase Pin-like site-specific DNA recombinase